MEECQTLLREANQKKKPTQCAAKAPLLFRLRKQEVMWGNLQKKATRVSHTSHPCLILDNISAHKHFSKTIPDSKQIKLCYSIRVPYSAVAFIQNYSHCITVCILSIHALPGNQPMLYCLTYSNTNFSNALTVLGGEQCIQWKI